MSVGGSIESLTLNGRTFSVAADADASRKLGGMENEVQPNGDGTIRVVQNRVAWMLDGVTVAIDDNNGDDEFLQDLADGASIFPVSITYASGAVYEGTGQLTGEQPVSSQNTTRAVSLMGQGKLRKQ